MITMLSPASQWLLDGPRRFEQVTIKSSHPFPKDICCGEALKAPPPRRPPGHGGREPLTATAHLIGPGANIIVPTGLSNFAEPLFYSLHANQRRVHVLAGNVTRCIVSGRGSGTRQKLRIDGL